MFDHRWLNRVRRSCSVGHARGPSGTRTPQQSRSAGRPCPTGASTPARSASHDGSTRHTRVIATCPVCDHELSVTRLHCEECGTTLEGRFRVGRFGRLSREQLALLESFLRARGNLRDMERELGISYPTVRNRVEALVRALGLAESGAMLGCRQRRRRLPWHSRRRPRSRPPSGSARSAASAGAIGRPRDRCRGSGTGAS